MSEIRNYLLANSIYEISCQFTKQRENREGKFEKWKCAPWVSGIHRGTSTSWKVTPDQTLSSWTLVPIFCNTRSKLDAVECKPSASSTRRNWAPILRLRPVFPVSRCRCWRICVAIYETGWPCANLKCTKGCRSSGSTRTRGTRIQPACTKMNMHEYSNETSISPFAKIDRRSIDYLYEEHYFEIRGDRQRQLEPHVEREYSVRFVFSTIHCEPIFSFFSLFKTKRNIYITLTQNRPQYET